MKLFEKKQQISRKEFRDTLRKRNPIVPGTFRKMFNFQERKQMEKRLFGKKLKAYTSREKYKRLVREVGREKYKVPDLSKKRIIDKKIRFLKKLGGI
ncbi:hypothetical protein KJA14_01335 [Patescibacteria group bacterium]|nr:hypothetical protein [Patescibacteria group bacterium]